MLTSIDRKIQHVDIGNGYENRPEAPLPILSIGHITHDQRTRRTVSGLFRNSPIISVVQPRTKRQMATNIEPPIMYGRRRPHFDFELSVIMPTSGCIMMPESGPAIHTADVRLFVRPSESRYGVQSASKLLGSCFLANCCDEETNRIIQCPK